MSALRTLRRRNRVAADNRARRVRPGTPMRRILFEVRVGPYLTSYHATKGWRTVRSPL